MSRTEEVYSRPPSVLSHSTSQVYSTSRRASSHQAGSEEITPANPFATPSNASSPGDVTSIWQSRVVDNHHTSRFSRNDCLNAASNTLAGGPYPRQRKCKTARLTDATYEKPWVGVRNPRRKYERLIFWGGVVLGFAVGGLICYSGFSSVTNSEVLFFA